MLNPRLELDLKVTAAQLGRSIEEIIFCTLHPEKTGPVRREEAIRSFSESVVRLIDQIK